MARSTKLPRENTTPMLCPHCDVVAQQWWSDLHSNIHIKPAPRVCQCRECEKVSIWYRGVMLAPATGGIQPPNPDLPPEIRADYNEARAVAAHSLRSAAALLRLAIEKLCVMLNGREMKLDEHIGALVAKGLDDETALMFDVVRLGGNNAIHPVDRIGVTANREIVGILFWLVNEIADDVITKPKKRAEAMQLIPEDERERIVKRNAKAKKQAVGSFGADDSNLSIWCRTHRHLIIQIQSAAALVSSRSVHRSRTMGLFLLSKHPDKLGILRATRP